MSRIWRDGGIFQEHDVTFIPSTTDADINRFFYFVRNWSRFISLVAMGATCVWIHTSASRSLYRKSLFILATALFRKKIVLHIHPSHFHDFLTSLRGFSRRYVFYVLRHVGIFVVLTNAMCEKIKALFPGKRVFILPNPVGVASLIGPRVFHRAANRLLYLGWYIPEKGIYELVDAVEILVQSGMDLELDFYGTKQIDRLKAYVKCKELQSRVRVNGWINLEKKIEALRTSTMLVLPSHSEGIPNVVLEAMATETPILATSVGGVKEILRDGENALIVEINNPIDLSEKIRQMLQDKGLRIRLSENAYRDAVEKYDVEIIKKEFRQIIASVNNED